MEKKLDINNYNFAHLTLILLLLYFVKSNFYRAVQRIKIAFWNSFVEWVVYV